MIAGHKLTAGNPDIADLSDAFRPTKVAEEFGQLYDNEWTSAFDELQKFTDNEVDLTDILAMIVKVKKTVKEYVELKFRNRQTCLSL